MVSGVTQSLSWAAPNCDTFGLLMGFWGILGFWFFALRKDVGSATPPPELSQEEKGDEDTQCSTSLLVTRMLKDTAA